MERRAYLTTIAVAGAGVLAGCSSSEGSDPNGGGGDGTQIELSDVEHKIDADTLHYLVGEATNVTDETLQFQVRIDWFDQEDTLLGESFTQVRAAIDAGQTRAWESTYYDADDHGPPDHYEIDVHIY